MRGFASFIDRASVLCGSPSLSAQSQEVADPKQKASDLFKRLSSIRHMPCQALQRGVQRNLQPSGGHECQAGCARECCRSAECSRRNCGVAHTVTEAGHPERVAPSELTARAAHALGAGNPDAVNAHNASLSAARTALAGSNTTNGEIGRAHV